MVNFRVLTPEEEDEIYAEKFPEQYEAEKRREAWDEKHPRCDACGQFLRKRVILTGGLELGAPLQSEWISHYVQDYWGEWDHV